MKKKQFGLSGEVVNCIFVSFCFCYFWFIWFVFVLIFCFNLFVFCLFVGVRVCVFVFLYVVVLFCFVCLFFPLNLTLGQISQTDFFFFHISSFMQPSIGILNSRSSRVVKDSTPSRRRILRYINFGIGESSPILFLDTVNLNLIIFEAW